MPLLIDVQRIPPGGERLQGALAAAELGIESEGLTVAGDLSYDLEVEVVSGEFLARGLLRVPVTLTCSRCTKRFAATVRVDRFSFNRRAGDTETIDLTENVREDIIIALPLKSLCRDDCRGLCPRCGRDLNTEACSCPRQSGDARWGALEGISFPPEKGK